MKLYIIKTKNNDLNYFFIFYNIIRGYLKFLEYTMVFYTRDGHLMQFFRQK